MFNIIILGMVSLLTDISTEMVYPLLPLFLTTRLGATPAVVGLIEGIAESLASLLKVFSGYLADLFGRKKPLAILGYGSSTVGKVVLYLAGSWPVVLAARVIDRFGKGVRTAPRDALIADSSTPETRGRAYGLHRAMDTLGAAVGVLLAYYFITAYKGDYGSVFLWAMVPAFLGVAVLFFARETRARALETATDGRAESDAHTSAGAGAGAGAGADADADADADAGANTDAGADTCAGADAGAGAVPDAGASAGTCHGAGPNTGTPVPAVRRRRPPSFQWSKLDRRLRGFLVVVFLFALGNSSNQFLLLRAGNLGFSPATVLLVYFLYNMVYSVLSYPAGRLSDRIGRKTLLVAGYATYGLVYLGFAFARTPWHVWALFAIYGAYIALTEGVEKALVADIAPLDLRATTIGLHATLVGIGLLPASLLAGFLWNLFGPQATFLFGGVMGLLAAVGIWAVV
ncbi:MAG: MFS transporter [Bacillota bacterium]|nr:MFS transporter [Bacillota bacterium]